VPKKVKREIGALERSQSLYISKFWLVFLEEFSAKSVMVIPQPSSYSIQQTLSHCSKIKGSNKPYNM